MQKEDDHERDLGQEHRETPLRKGIWQCDGRDSNDRNQRLGWRRAIRCEDELTRDSNNNQQQDQTVRHCRGLKYIIPAFQPPAPQ